MNNIGSPYQEFREYFDSNRKHIDYFLEVLKTVKEDKWEYEYRCLNFSFDKIETKILKYATIRIVYTIKTYYDSIDGGAAFEEEIEVLVDNKKIFEIDDDENENYNFFRKIISFIDQVEQRKAIEK